MSAVDDKVERGADKLEQLVDAGTRAGGRKAKVARMFADDPAFLRTLKPSLIAARAKGKAPTGGEPTQVSAPSSAPQGEQRQPKAERPKGRGGPSPLLILGAALAAGMLLAHVIDWLGQRYPRD